MGATRGRLSVWAADDELGVGATVIATPTRKGRTTPSAIALEADEIPWLIEQLQRIQRGEEI